MKESVRSLKAFLGVVGILSILNNLGELYLYLTFENENLIGILLTIIGLGLSGLFVYLSFNLKPLLLNSLSFVRRVILASTGFHLFSLVFYCIDYPGVAKFIQPFYGVLMCGYLFITTNRLSRSLQEELVQVVSENNKPPER
jgi:hypothetical protein